MHSACIIGYGHEPSPAAILVPRFSLPFLMTKKILITRLVGLGDVAAILVPAARLLRQAEPYAKIDVLTYKAGVELMSLCKDVDNVLNIAEEQWPRNLAAAAESFLGIAQVVAAQGYERIICLDTWFMPCFLARVLKDVGLNVEGNYIDMPAVELLQKMHDNQLEPAYFQHTNFMASSYPRMVEWQTAWWLKPQNSAHYPEFFLIHCCELGSSVDLSMPIEPDLEFKEQSEARRIIAVSFQGSSAMKRYKHAEALVARLKSAGHLVWTGFDGSLPMKTTLGRLAVTDLLITVATSTQWLARLVGCPSLMLPGSMHPAALGAEFTAEQVVDCQYCCQTTCPAGRDFACMDVPTEDVIKKVSECFASRVRP